VAVLLRDAQHLGDHCHRQRLGDGIERVAQVIADRGLRSVFIESSVPRQTINAVLASAASKGVKASVGGELYADSAGSEGTPEGTYIGMVKANVDKIVEGLS